MNVNTVSQSLSVGLIALAIGAYLPFSYSAPLASGALTGQIGVQLTIGDACTVSNGSSAAGANGWGTIDFGTYSDLRYAIDGNMVGSGGANAVSITCSSGLSPMLKIDGGLNKNTNNLRAMIGPTSQLIAYRLYSAGSRSAASEIAPDGSIELPTTTGPHEIPLYARVLPADQAPDNLSPASGLYTDTVTATLSW